MRLHLLVLAACFWILTEAQQFQPEPSAFRPHSADIGSNRERRVDVVDNGNNGKSRPNRVGLEAERQRVLANLQTQNRFMVAGGKNDFAQAVGPDGPNQRSSASRYGDSGGAANAGRHRGVMRNQQDSDRSQWANLTADGRVELNTKKEHNGGRDPERFWANGTRRTFGVDPVDQTARDGKGVFHVGDSQARKNDLYLYEIHKQNQDDWEAQIADPEADTSGGNFNLITSLFGGKSTKYRCVAAKVGESICHDQFGRQAGKVVANEQGDVTVYTKLGVPIARGKCTPVDRARKNWDCKISDGLVQATAENYEERDCMRDYGQPENKNVRIESPLTFNYQHEVQSDGSKVFKWPDCFDINGGIQLTGFTQAELQDFGKRLAVEWLVNVLPAGRLRCVDPGTCGRQCYYCNLCKNATQSHKLDMLDNTDSNICDIDSQSRMRLKATICPPPEAFEWASCTGFSKKVGDDYWKKAGDIHTEMRLFLRPQSEEEIRREFFRQLNSLRLVLQAEWIASNAGELNFSPTDADLLKFYVDKKIKEQTGNETGQLIGCRRAVVNYNIGGRNVNTGFLLEGASAAGDPGSFFRNPKCPKWEQLQQDEYNEYQRQYGSSGSSGGGGFGSFIPGFGGSSGSGSSGGGGLGSFIPGFGGSSSGGSSGGLFGGLIPGGKRRK